MSAVAPWPLPDRDAVDRQRDQAAAMGQAFAEFLAARVPVTYPTLAETEARFLAFLAGRSPRTRETYASALRRFDEYLGCIGVNPFEESADALPTSVLEDFLGWLRTTYQPRSGHGREGRPITTPSGITPVAVATYLAGVRSFWRFLCRRHLAPPRFVFEEMRDNAHDAIGRMSYHAPKIDRRLPLVVQHVERLALPSEQDAPARFTNWHDRHAMLTLTLLRDKALVRALFATGMRRQEISRLNRDDVRDGLASQAIIRGKGDKDRAVFFDAKALAAIRTYLAARQDTYAPLFIRHDHRRGRPGPKGEAWRLSCQSIWLVIKKYAAELGIEAKPHHLRHLKACTLLNRGATLSEVQDLLGHADPGTTKLVYAHYDTRTLRRAFDRYSADSDELVAELEAEAASFSPGALT